MIVTSHRPGYLPGVSVIAKVAQADAVVWLDDVRFTTPGFVNRNQLPDGTWLAVPFDRENHRSTIREVTIGHDGGGWRHEHDALIRERYAHLEHFDPRITAVLDGPLAEPGQPLADLNLVLLSHVLEDLGLPVQQFRQSDYPTPGGSLSSKLVRMVKAVGGTAYLSGPTSALDPAQFAAAGIDLLFFRYAGDNPTVIDPLFRTGELPARPLQEVNVA